MTLVGPCYSVLAGRGGAGAYIVVSGPVLISSVNFIGEPYERKQRECAATSMPLSRACLVAPRTPTLMPVSMIWAYARICLLVAKS